MGNFFHNFYFYELIATVLVQALGLFILFNNPKRILNWIFFGLTFVISGYVGGNFLIEFTTLYMPQFLLISQKITIFFAAFHPPFLILFALFFPLRQNPLKPSIIFALLFPGIYFSSMAFTNLYITKLVVVDGIRDGVFYWPYKIFAAYFVIFVMLSFIILLKRYRETEVATLKKQIKIMLIGFIISYSIGAVFSLFLPLFNQHQYEVIGPLGVLILTGAISYAIFKHNLLDIRLFIKRSSYFLMLYLIIIAPIVLLTNLSTSRFERFFGGYQTLITAGIWTLVVLGSDWIKKILTQLTDHIFYRGGYTYEEVMNRVSRKLQEITDIHILMFSLYEDLTKYLKVSQVGVYIMNKSQRKYIFLTLENLDYTLNSDHHKKHLDKIVGLNEDHPLIRRIKNTNQNYVWYDELKIEYEANPNEDLRECIAHLDKTGSHLLIASFYRHRINGILAVDRKKSGDMFTQKDLKLLSFIVNQGTLVLTRIFEIEEKSMINAEKELQEQHRRQLEAKNHLMEDALQQLRFTQDKLIEEEQLSAMGKLAGEVAHDIRNPLSSINRLLCFLEDEDLLNQNEQVLIHIYKAMEQGKFELSNPKNQDMLKLLLTNNSEVKETLAEINTINGTLRNIANDFLEYSKVSKDIPTEKVILKDQLTEQLNEYKRYTDLKKENVSVKTNFKTSKKVLMFPYQIQKVFINILDNAVKAGREGIHNAIEIELFDDELELIPMIHLKIKDSGIGMEKAMIKNLFKPFFTKRKNLSGTGLGLAIVKKILNNVHGEIQVESDLGTGTTFNIFLPAHE